MAGEDKTVRQKATASGDAGPELQPGGLERRRLEAGRDGLRGPGPGRPGPRGPNQPPQNQPGPGGSRAGGGSYGTASPTSWWPSSPCTCSSTICWAASALPPPSSTTASSSRTWPLSQIKTAVIGASRITGTMMNPDPKNTTPVDYSTNYQAQADPNLVADLQAGRRHVLVHRRVQPPGRAYCSACCPSY